MPVGYSEDVRLQNEVARAKGVLDILTMKLDRVKKEYEAAEGEYKELLARLQQRQSNAAAAQVSEAEAAAKLPNNKKRFGRREE